MFTRAAVTLRIWSINGIGDLGLVVKESVVSIPSEIVYWYFLCYKPIALSTWMHTFALPLVLPTSIRSSQALPLVNASITNSALLNETLSWIVKPLVLVFPVIHNFQSRTCPMFYHPKCSTGMIWYLE